MPSAGCGGFRGVAGGKFLVLRRDGSVPDWTWFVLGAADPASPAALRAYARTVAEGSTAFTPELAQYARNVKDLAADFIVERLKREGVGRKKGDPEAPPHRVDDPLVLALMSGIVTWAQVRRAWEAHYGLDNITERVLADIGKRELAQDHAALLGEGGNP